VNLPSLPSGWEYRPIKRVADLRFSSVDKLSLPDEEPVRLCNYLDVYRNDRITASLDFMNATATPSERMRFALSSGDVLLTKDSEDPLDIGIPACVVEPLPGILCGYHLAMLRPHPNTMDGRFLHRTLTASGVRDQFFSKAAGVTRFGLGLGDVGDSVVPVPPLWVQRGIAAFLDRKTAAIDALIQKKERLVELIQERLQALITQAVTKGLDLTVPMKESGIYWLGRIPSHWKLEPNGRLFRETDERGLRDLPVLSVSLSTGVEERDFSEDRIQPKMSDFADYKVARRGDVVFNKMRMWQGAVGVAPVDGFVSPDYTVLRPGPESNPWFFTTLYRTAGYTCEVNRFSHGIALDRNRIYWDAFKNILSPVPPRPEQDAIAAEVRRLKNEVGKRVGVLERGTALLREYRQALISAAVTGKIEIPVEEAA
jgi:type I restriction enzyme S subunit